MTVIELNREQLIELKGNYLCKLDDEGTLEEITGLDAVYLDTLAKADEIVPDDVIFKEYDGYDFVNEDFGCSMDEREGD